MEGPDREDKQRRTDPGFLALGLRYAAIASQFAVSLAVLGYIGHTLDERMGWAPWGVLGGILSGMGLGLTAMLKQIEKLEASATKKKSGK